MAQHEFDLLIAGAGPAGCTLALNMAAQGLTIGIIEKETFPRKKICGDALSGKVLSVMKRIPGDVYEEFIRDVEKIPSWGIRFIAPSSQELDVPFLLNRKPEHPPPGYVCKRDDFDNFMFAKLQNHPNIHIFQGGHVSEVTSHPEGVVVKTQDHEFRGKVIAGADGVHSVVRKSLLGTRADKKHFCVGIRGYFENVTGLHQENFIELIFLKRLLPGYFWIFPSTGGLVNAGFGMMQPRIIQRRENLSSVFQELISSDPLIAPRFINARPVGKPEAHTLPMGTYHFCRSGNRFLLLGDAAFLVDPFSGEGIGNAMASSEIAASVLKGSFSSNDFSAKKFKAYDTRLGQRFSQEFRTMSVMQTLARSSHLFNLVVKKACKNQEVGELLTAMFTSDQARKKLTRPGFYLRLLFR